MGLSSLPGAVLGALLLLSVAMGVANADPASYFSQLTSDEKGTYASWLADNSASYPRRAFMPSGGDPDDGAAVFWNIEDNVVNFALAVRAEGWAGFGISEAGGMIGSDVALFESSDPSELIDAHVVDSRSKPMTDDCQDWTLKSALNEDGWIILEMSRLLNTNDSQDHAIHNDLELWSPPTRIIAAWGDTDEASFHAGKHARSSVRLYADHSDELTEMEALLEVLEKESDNYFEVRENGFEIPQEDTTYQDLCVTFDELNLDLPEGQTTATMIGAVPIITEETAKYVHHFTVYLQKDCTWGSFLTRSMLYVWAPGDEGWALPPDVGFPMFDGENSQAIHIQTHYDNPDLVPGLKDSSGVRFYYSHDARTHEAGMLEIGDPWLSLMDEPVGEGLTRYEFTCPGECSSFFLSKERNGGDSQGVTILGEFLHMHQSGVRMTNEVIRDGEVVHKAINEVYDFEQQGGYHVPQETYQFMPNDSWRTTCYYKDGTVFGESSQEEMCITFILYYPKQKYAGSSWVCPYKPFMDFGTGCSGELQQSNIESAGDLGRSFGVSSGECGTESTTDASTPTVPSLGPGEANPPALSPVEDPSTVEQPSANDPVVINVPPPKEPADGVGCLGTSLFLSAGSLLLAAILM